MTEIIRPAVKIQQGNQTLLGTSFTVADFKLTDPDFFSISRLDPESASDTGFQRLLQEDRANKLARYAVEAWRKNRQTFLPTSIFLATDKNIAFDAARNEIRFNRADVCPFDVVDGQHRIMGLLRAAETESELEQFPIAVNIAVESPRTEQMLHFYVVNMTQRTVDPSVGQRIRARFTKMLQTENLPYIPSWIKRSIEKGTDMEVLSFVDFLNSSEESPFRHQIQLANQPRPKNYSITQKSFVTALRSSIAKEGHPISYVGNNDEQHRVFKNYWIAVERIFTNGKTRDNTVVFKSIGAVFFCRLSSAVIGVANSTTGKYTVDNFVEIFESVREDLPSDIDPIMHPDWWVSGSNASDMNSGAAEKKAMEFARVINSTGREKILEKKS